MQEETFFGFRISDVILKKAFERCRRLPNPKRKDEMNFYNCPLRIILIIVITVITVIITIITIIIIKSFDSTHSKGFYDKLSLDNINIITCIKVIISCRLDKYQPRRQKSFLRL